MILIGQYDSPFVRRVAIALRLYGMAFEHRPWSVFSDAAALARYNPLMRVPTLVLDDGEVLIESGAILDHLDELAGPSKALVPGSGPKRRHALKICALATGLADKAASLLYERLLHQTLSQVWVDRCNTQLTAALDVLEAARREASTTFWFADVISHADIAVACALRLTREAHPQVFDAHRWPRLAAHAEHCEDFEAFRAIVQPLVPPA